jgi:nicotinamidase-related amidase
MQEIEGKIVLTEIEEIVDPSHTALVILGAQNNAIDLIFNKNEFMTSLSSLVQSAREKKIPIFFSRIQYHPLKYQSSVWIYTSNRLITRPRSPSEQGLALAIEPAHDDRNKYAGIRHYHRYRKHIHQNGFRAFGKKFRYKHFNIYRHSYRFSR